MPEEEWTAANDVEGREELVSRLNDAYRRLNQSNAALDEAQSQLARRVDEIVQLYEHAPVGMALFDSEARHLRVNRRLAEMTGLSPQDHIGRTSTELFDGAGAEIDAITRTVGADGQPVRRRRVVAAVPATGGDERVFEIDWYPVRSGGAIVGVGMMVDDVTDRVVQEERSWQMLHELQHRVKNSLANVLALIEQARRSDGSKEEALDTLRERLHALARVHAMLSEANWAGLGLAQLLSAELERFPPSRYRITGPEVRLGSQAALAFSIALHELVANAARFGALDPHGGGRLAVSWQVHDGWLHIDWRETLDGRTLRPASALGFGSRLIVASIRSSLHGSLERETLPSGFGYRIGLPVDFIAPRAEGFRL